MSDTLKAFRGKVDMMASFNYAMRTIYWDGATGAPRTGAAVRGKNLGLLTKMALEIMMSDEVQGLLDEMKTMDLSPIDAKMAEELQREIDKNKKVPIDVLANFQELIANAEVTWEEAKEKSDFSIFEPDLQKVFDMLKEIAECRGYEGHIYNVFLDDFDRGMTVEQLDKFFATLKSRVVPLVKKIKESGEDFDTSIFSKFYAKEDQLKLSHNILETIGFDTKGGQLEESAHPFTNSLDPSDVRLTTQFREHQMDFAMYATIHEGGHSIYEQNIDMQYSNTMLATGTSAGIHESQSRIFENNFCKSREFIEYYYPTVVEHFPEQLVDVSVDTFYNAINKVEPSLIRIEADELTYSLHIMMRYEIEKGLFTGEYEVKDLPKIWNEKMVEYLGVEPSNDAEGVLQDMHWASGLVGYFPSYALGTAFACQLIKTMEKTLDVKKALSTGNFDVLVKWLAKEIHTHGTFKTPDEIMMDVTGELLNPDYYCDYLEEKFCEIYNINMD